ncbi:cyclin-Y-like protein 1 isoform X2 [Saccopteryx leptura]|uniref:cyclin-Y-like protein 1 isoform X2 n=1 Tax=Saccopteryx leptura TaxID=249018 RepID=UPI00339CBA39
MTIFKIVKEMVEVLEDLLQYDVNISKKIYFGYYLELRLRVYKDLDFECHPLNQKRAQELEAFSRWCGDEDLHRNVLRKSVIADNLTGTQHSQAVLP